MPITKSAKKAVRISTRRRVINKSTRSLSKTAVTRAEEAIAAGNIEEAQAAVTSAISSLDKAAEKGIIHANNAARRKSRLVQKLNKAARPAV